jgi:hypothetical protein
MTPTQIIKNVIVKYSLAILLTSLIILEKQSKSNPDAAGVCCEK